MSWGESQLAVIRVGDTRFKQVSREVNQVRHYLHLLAHKRFALLWAGLTISVLGDGLTWTSLVWLVYEITGSSAGVGLLVVIYTAPVIVGGLFAGLLLDRFDRRKVLMADNAVRGTFMAMIPVLFHLGSLQLWHLYLAAGVYGLFKMISLAGIPSLLPSLVPENRLTTANAMESISYGVGGVIGPALAGILIGSIGGANTIALDALSYYLFVACLIMLPSFSEHKSPASSVGRGLRPALQFIRATPAIWFITLMFMSVNIGLGMLSVLLPVYTKEVLRGDATTFGLLLSANAVGGLVGSVLIGGVAWPWTLGRSIAAAQFATGVSFISLLSMPGLALTLLLLSTAHLLESPLTIWAQTIRMRLIPPPLRGRVFSILRTLMQSAPPVGGMLGTALLTGFSIPITVLAIVLFIGIPGAVGLVHPALAHQQTVAPMTEIKPHRAGTVTRASRFYSAQDKS
jgi:MFS family permease